MGSETDGRGLRRRDLIAAAGASLAAGGIGPAPARPRKVAPPPGFLWGTAISAHQSEGNNVNSDAWVMEKLKPSLFKERSGDACDSYHRYGEDMAIAARLGFNAYRRPAPINVRVEIDHARRHDGAGDVAFLLRRLRDPRCDRRHPLDHQRRAPLRPQGFQSTARNDRKPVASSDRRARRVLPTSL